MNIFFSIEVEHLVFRLQTVKIQIYSISCTFVRRKRKTINNILLNTHTFFSYKIKEISEKLYRNWYQRYLYNVPCTLGKVLARPSLGTDFKLLLQYYIHMYNKTNIDRDTAAVSKTNKISILHSKINMLVLKQNLTESYKNKNLILSS